MNNKKHANTVTVALVFFWVCKAMGTPLNTSFCLPIGANAPGTAFLGAFECVGRDRSRFPFFLNRKTLGVDRGAEVAWGYPERYILQKNCATGGCTVGDASGHQNYHTDFFLDSPNDRPSPSSVLQLTSSLLY